MKKCECAVMEKKRLPDKVINMNKAIRALLVKELVNTYNYYLREGIDRKTAINMTLSGTVAGEKVISIFYRLIRQKKGGTNFLINEKTKEF